MLHLQPGKKSPVQSPHGGLTQGGIKQLPRSFPASFIMLSPQTLFPPDTLAHVCVCSALSLPYSPPVGNPDGIEAPLGCLPVPTLQPPQVFLLWDLNLTAAAETGVTPVL